jgi:hypothetical protein
MAIIDSSFQSLRQNINDGNKASATPAYPKPLGVSFPLLALDNLHIFSQMGKILTLIR